MIPGMSGLLGGAGEAQAANRMKRIQFIFDSMTAEELDSDGGLFRSSGKSGEEEVEEKEKAVGRDGAREPNKRVLRVARGSGTSVQEVEELLSQHVMFAKMAKKMGGKNGLYVDFRFFPFLLSCPFFPSLLFFPSFAHPSSSLSLSPSPFLQSCTDPPFSPTDSVNSPPAAQAADPAPVLVSLGWAVCPQWVRMGCLI
jgi:hypothetical protein